MNDATPTGGLENPIGRAALIVAHDDASAFDAVVPPIVKKVRSWPIFLRKLFYQNLANQPLKILLGVGF